ncbi:ATP-binding protein [Desulfobotulus sp. H1]|uniref:ATP-binding protein n=1 Tax=Desulfobotulus pelophilus TaxID=2823377 RepID=A0ABT3N9N9_9BACT|nr:ATP-binding protein [Desulfobotulus pelophilus]MCW7754155.1 ATP-binding protein [Desulfobotulus pelophilus]
MMLEAFKQHKTIRHMTIGEEGYGQAGAIFRDEQDRIWLHLNGKISKRYAGNLTPLIRKTGDHPTAYDVDTSDIFTPFAARSHNLERHSDFICLDEELFVQKKTSTSYATHTVSRNPVPYGDILAPLFEIFMEPTILNEVLIRTSIPEVLRNEPPLSSGVILYGEGGTGKTALQKAIADVYQKAGAHSAELNVAALSEKYIGSLAHNLDAAIAAIVETSSKDGKPAFVFLDEATSLVMNTASHNSSGADYYQEAVDVLKKYIANYPDLVFSITTNADPETFDDTLIRDGRLAPVRIPVPGRHEKAGMWQFFIKKYNILDDISMENALQLADRIPMEKGAFISRFCKDYLARKKLAMETARAETGSLLDSLAAGHFVSLDSVKKQITLQTIMDDIGQSLENRPGKPARPVMGFVKKTAA